jgi:membrane-bound ClpP family serine protease
VYFANRSLNAQIDPTDPTYFVEMLEDTKGEPIDLLLDTIGGWTDSTERIVSILEQWPQICASL